ncbi:MAG: hypothetical protein GY816_16650, partial [Cytophagales bacterium]|nr:hypothetical protein [Cytophagales bacterium]
PLGFFAPITMPAKFLFQSLWKQQMKWDDYLSEDQLVEWNSIKEELHQIENHKLPRFLYNTQNTTYELHCFSDASAKVYATCIYLRCMTVDGTQHQKNCNLIFSKARLAPIGKTKPISIPRLELLAVFVGVKMMGFVSKQLQLPIQSQFLWSDSKCVLDWIRCTRPLPVFVENRIKQIREATEISFNYVSTKENPADLSTRGCSMKNLMGTDLWWNGPEWLLEDKNLWPGLENNHLEMENTNVGSVSALAITASNTPAATKTQREINLPAFPVPVERFSSAVAFHRILAWLLRFFNNCRSAKSARSVGFLSASELESAKLYYVKVVQQSHYAIIIANLQKEHYSGMPVQLRLFLDEKGLIRCGGRLENTNLTFGCKYPMLLPSGD